MSDIVFLMQIVAAGLFIYGLKRMSKVKTAERGNRFAMIAMGLGVLATLLALTQAPGLPSFENGEVVMKGGGLTGIQIVWILLGIGAGAAAGYFAATKVEMTAMPQMVAIFNGFGGIASALVAGSWFFARWDAFGGENGAGLIDLSGGGDSALIFCLSILIGTLTFSGSIVAFAKLQEIKIAGKWMSDAITLPGGKTVTLGLLGGSLVCIIIALLLNSGGGLFVILLIFTVVALALGIYLTMPIGGADMPVVISLLNSYSGIAAAMAGFVVGDLLLIVGGSMVGSAGLILTSIMCKAMNRSLWNVIQGGVGGAAAEDAREYNNIKQADPADMAIDMENASSVIIVPGYGLAVAQAQHAVKELTDLLEEKGVQVRFAIHPVAGRMPGHMNVLLAEADIDYDKLLEMDEINADFKNTDAAVILGANDVVNPAALTDESSPLWGMPILNVHEARQVFIIKRSLSPGYAGVRNPLFDADNARMVFGDGKQVLLDALEELKSDD